MSHVVDYETVSRAGLQSSPVATALASLRARQARSFAHTYDAGRRAVELKLSEGTEIPAELAERFRFARRRSKLAGTLRGSFLVLRHEP